MNRSEILNALDTEIARLQQARVLLADSTQLLAAPSPARRGPGRPKGSRSVTAGEPQTSAPSAPKRTLSPEGKARIAAAQKARWAKLHKVAGKKVTSKKVASKKVEGKTLTGRKVASGKKSAPSRVKTNQASKLAKKAVPSPAPERAVAKKTVPTEA